MTPTIGRIVIFKTNEAQQEHLKNTPYCNVSKELPAIIVAVFSESTVNLKVMLDGPGEFWVTSALQGDEPGNWNWPVIAPQVNPVDPK